MKQLKINFNNQKLLDQALIHKSYLNEHPEFELGNNERLEFLGDAVLELVVTEYLFKYHENKDEGEMTAWRSALVNTKMLARIAKEFKLEEKIRLSEGEKKDNEKGARNSILANVMEAVIGAIYLDQGYEITKDFVKENIISKLQEVLEKKLFIDAKSKFQELAQEQRGLTPRYGVISESGPDHDKSFEVGIYLNKELIAVGQGASKQEAQEKAARAGIDKLFKDRIK